MCRKASRGAYVKAIALKTLHEEVETDLAVCSAIDFLLSPQARLVGKNSSCLYFLATI